MPIELNEQNDRQLRIGLQTRQSCTRITEAKAQDAWLRVLKDAKNMKQAEALIANVPTLDELKLIAKFGFDKLKDNAPQTIRAAIAAAPAAIRVAAQQALLQDQLNDSINGYLISLPAAYRRHMAGTFNQALPLEDQGPRGVEIVARPFNNGQQRLPVLMPPNTYIEWYAKVGSTRSPHKRFFTTFNRLYFSDGGTHGNMVDWYRLDGDNWVQI